MLEPHNVQLTTSPDGVRRAWETPTVEDLPRLTMLTLQTCSVVCEAGGTGSAF